MAKTITWKPKASQQYRELVGYLKDEFSEATAQKFIEKVTAKMTLLEHYPESGQTTRFKTVHRVKIGKYNSFYYRIAGSKIIILFIWDGRIDPDKNPYR
jgi:plasmid stabilization system protein ParE